MPTASELGFVMVYKGILELSEHNLRNSVYTFDAHFTQLCILLTFTIQSGYRQNDSHQFKHTHQQHKPALVSRYLTMAKGNQTL